MNRRLTTKSSELLSALHRGHAPKPYSNAGKHLLQINCKITSSVARPLILPSIACIGVNIWMRSSRLRLNPAKIEEPRSTLKLTADQWQFWLSQPLHLFEAFLLFSFNSESYNLVVIQLQRSCTTSFLTKNTDTQFHRCATSRQCHHQPSYEFWCLSMEFTHSIVNKIITRLECHNRENTAGALDTVNRMCVNAQRKGIVKTR